MMTLMKILVGVKVRSTLWALNNCETYVIYATYHINNSGILYWIWNIPSNPIINQTFEMIRIAKIRHTLKLAVRNGQEVFLKEA